MLSAVRHLRSAGSWTRHQTPGFAYIACHHTGIRPLLATTDTGNVLIGWGTPTRGSTGIFAARTAIADWLRDVTDRGLTTLGDCEGLYTFVHRDASRRKLEVLCDRSGMVGMYYAADEHGIWISSSALAIACVHPTRLNRDCWACLTVVGYPLRDVSLFEGIRRVMPGELVSCDADGVHVARWWTPPLGMPANDPPRELARRFVQEQTETLRTRFGDAARIICTLTGGLDTRSLVALVHPLKLPVKYFTGESENPSDRDLARDIAARLKLDWEYHPVGKTSPDAWRELFTQVCYLTDGEKQPLSFLSRWSVDLAHEHHIMLWGIGGEVYKDHWSKHEPAAFLLKGKDQYERLINWRTGDGHIPYAAFDPSFREEARERVLALLYADDQELQAIHRLSRLDLLYAIERVRRWAALHMFSSGWWIIPDIPMVRQNTFDLIYRLRRDARSAAAFQRWVIWHAWPACGEIPNNQGYTTRPPELMNLSERLRWAWLDLNKLYKKVSRRLLKKTADLPPVADQPTYRSLFGDMLDVATMKSAAYYTPQGLQNVIERGIDRNLTGQTPLNLITGLEIAIRAARMLRA